MSTVDRDRLREIRTFSSLVKYLRDELDWPIETDNFDELTFEYEPEELGIDSKTAAKIQEIKQLRPLSTGQPWGIFFVKFEPKRLPVVALRRILGQLVFRKRASANAAERQSWNKHDLLFVSNYGEGDDRQITFAHFTENEQLGDLPTLKVLGWDGGDTPLHLDHVQHELTDKLRWPDDSKDLTGWRQKWASAFTIRNREVVTTSQQLALRLADLARDIRKKANAALAVENDKGPLRRLMKAFQTALIHDLNADDFADMYAQTIAYGLLSARVSRPEGLVADNVADMVPITNPFLKELMQTFLHLGGRRRNSHNGTGIDFDELGINEVVELLRDANMEAVLRDFGNRNAQEDPVIYFYQDFLREYDAKKRMQRGVFYTPRPVVSYIVRAVHELLQTEFGLADGLADTTTWGQMLEKHKELKLPIRREKNPNAKDQTEEYIDPATPFVQILDPATGTATFLVEVIDIIHKTMLAKWKKQGHTEMFDIPKLWNDYVPKHLLPRLHGYELMMAPYAIAHMKIGLKLFETGYKFGSGERARIYLTNALEPPQDFSDTFEQMAPALAHEAKAVNDVKRHQRFTVVIGNPPYSKLSANWNEWIDNLLHGRGSDTASTSDYYQVDGAGLGERTVWIQDDYIKFTRLSQWQIDRTGTGVHGFISNNGYLDNPTLRGMRQQLRSSFPCMHLLDLHGSMKRGEVGADGSADGNVFDIQQGVAIGIFLKPPSRRDYVRHGELWGDRTSKYQALLAGRVSSADWVTLDPASPFHLFVPVDSANQAEYDAGWKVTDIFAAYHTGIITKRDALTIHWTKADVLRTVSDFMSLSPKAASEKYRLPDDVRDWKVEWAQEDLRRTGVSKDRAIPVLYRPFDVRFTYFTGRTRGFVGWPVADMTELMRSGDNVALVTTRMTKGEDFAHVMATRWMAEVICLSSKTSNNGFVFPLHASTASQLVPSKTRESNIRPAFIAALPAKCEPEKAFDYVFALLHSPTYRSRYREFLSRDFPRVLLPKESDAFDALARLGKQLIQLHLLESSIVARTIASYMGPPSPEVDKLTYTNGTAWLDRKQTCGFAGVPDAVWNFHIGGYQVCEKWLKDRKGRTLSKDDIAHYQRIVVAISETIRLMTEIDEVINKHGGWPGAFITDPKVLEGLTPKKA